MEAIDIETPFTMPGDMFSNWKRIARRMVQKLWVRSSIQEFDYVDPATGQTTYLTVTDKYAVLSCGDDQWYFDKYRRA